MLTTLLHKLFKVVIYGLAALGLLAGLIVLGLKYIIDTDIEAEQARPLYAAVWKGDIEGIRSALDQGIDINTPQTAEGYAGIDTEKHYHETYGTTPLHYAVQSPHNPLDTVAFLLDHGADIDATDNSGAGVLHYVVRHADPKYQLALIRLLVRRGADINQGDEYGATPLHHAIWSNAPNEVVRVLTELGADVNARITENDPPILIKGDTPLLFLMRHDSSPSGWKLTWLVTHGADVNARNHLGETPLLAHIKEHGSYSDPDAVRYLVFKGADASLRDNENHTALDYLKAATEKEDSGILAGEVKEMTTILHGQEPERKKHQRLLEWLTVYGSLDALKQDFDTLSHGIKRSFLEKLPEFTERSETVEREAKLAFLLKALRLADDDRKDSPSHHELPAVSTANVSAETASRQKEQHQQTSEYQKLISACEVDNNSKACRELAIAHLKGGNGFEKDSNRSLAYAIKACEAGDEVICEDAGNYIEKLIDKGDLSLDTRRFNERTVQTLYDKGCKMGREFACMKLKQSRQHQARLERKRRKIEEKQQHLERRKAMAQACENKKDADACAKLAEEYIDGNHGFPANERLALKFGYLACWHGKVGYCYEVGQYYENTIGKKRPLTAEESRKVILAYRKGCELDDKKSCRALKAYTAQFFSH